MKHRTSASFGKRQEYTAVAELLRRGFDVYMTLVDDQQIDCIIRQERDDGSLRYLDIQIKARSQAAKHPGTFAAMTIRKPRPDFWFMFYSEPLDTTGLFLPRTWCNSRTATRAGRREAAKTKAS